MNYSSKKDGKPPTYSDHNSILVELDMKIKKYIPERKVIYNYRDMEAMKKFKEVTSNDNKETI